MTNDWLATETLSLSMAAGWDSALVVAAGVRMRLEAEKSCDAFWQVPVYWTTRRFTVLSGDHAGRIATHTEWHDPPSKAFPPPGLAPAPR